MQKRKTLQKKKTSNINMRVAPQMKSELEYLFGTLGMSIAQATNMFYAKALLVGKEINFGT